MATTVSALDPYFTSLITNLMDIERQPLARLQNQRDTLNVRTAVYRDVDSKLGELQDAVQALTSSSFSPALAAGRSFSISNVSSGYTVLSASVGSRAMVGNYDISVTTLAREHRVRSDKQTYSDQALGYSGTVLLGGASARAQTTASTIAGTVTASDLDAPVSGQEELGSGTYYVETRNDATEGWQFRLVDSEGNPVSIQEGGNETYTSDWQSIPTGGGLYNTGRGLTITFGADSQNYLAASKGAGAAQVDYTAEAASISIDATDSLNDIANKINDASYPQGNGVVATVVDRQLVLAAENTGTGHSVIASDASGTVLQSLGLLTGTGAFKNEMQTALDASFSVNGLQVTRSKNSGLTDVISGVTLNLASDAEGKSGTLSVSENWSEARSAIDTFLAKFNDVQSYLATKTSIVIDNSGDTTTYTRGPLADDNIFSELRANLFSLFISNSSNSGAFKNLRDIGLTINDSLQAGVSDSAALDDALNSHLDDVVALMDQVMSQFDTRLGRFTGSTGVTGYLDNAVSAFNNQMADINSGIKDMNLHLTEREQYLTNQYAEIQAQLLNLTYSQQMWQSIYGSVNSMM